MFTKLSHVQTALEAKIAAGTLVGDEHAVIRLKAAIEVLQGFLATRHSLFLRQIASSMLGYLFAVVSPRHPIIGAGAGYLIARCSTLFENIDTWYFLTPEDLPSLNSGFWAKTLKDVNNTHSVEELVRKLQNTALTVKNEIDAFNNTTSTVAATAGAGIGYAVGSTPIAQNLITYNWPGKSEVIKAMSTGVFSMLGVGCGFAAEGVQIMQEEIVHQHRM